ncbi:excalibur calcium-binding domain-containing protein [Sphingosinicellaceae bacterium]|nr:excalibur calcium-binding domain-containing protein [Sphingosinicellaceae bacterium]
MVSIVGIVWAVAIVMVAQLGLRSFGFGSESVAIRHLVAALGCGAASEVGLAPAHRGDPGYWSRLDPANDGVSCKSAALPSRVIVHRG